MKNSGSELITGGSHVDARGSMRFCNDFTFPGVKRFYTIANSSEMPRRGWIMHKRESKWFFPLRGETVVLVNADACFRGSRRYVLEAARPAVLSVPPGNWFLIEQHGDAEVQVFSDCAVGEFPGDDFRKDCE